MNLTIVKAGDPVLRQAARALEKEEIRSEYLQVLVSGMRDLMRSVNGVGLAAPQVGESVQLTAIEDRPENLASLSEEGAGQRYLVAPRGDTQWVRNLRASGRGELRWRRGIKPLPVYRDRRRRETAQY
jgi:hypothetical protein